MSRITLLLAAMLLAPEFLPGQTPQIPVHRPLGAITATSSERFTSIQGVRALPGGGVLVNDVASRRVVLLDSGLGGATVIADSTSATANAYSGRIAGLIPFRGDSTLFVDPTSLSMLVLDPGGKVSRVMSVPRSEDAISLATGALGTPGLDADGRLVYRQAPRFQFRAPPGGGQGARGALPDPGAIQLPDSLPIVRVDLVTRQLDTVAYVRVPRPNMHVTQAEGGRVRMTAELNPLPVVDEWAVMADGSIALVRGRDYRVEFIGTNGVRTTPVKIPFEWQRLSDEDKVAFIDSVRVARERLQANTSGGSGAGVGTVERTELGGGNSVVVMRQGAPGNGGAMGGGAGGPGSPNVVFIAPDQLPDYKPAFFAGAVRADADGNLWIRTIPTRAIPGGPIYDVVNGRGELVERVQIPEGRTIVGFAPGGTVFMSTAVAAGVVLERATTR